MCSVSSVFKSMRLFKRLFLPYFIIFCAFTSYASTPGGLKFHGSEQPINQRTSYDVFGKEEVEFSNSFDIAFENFLFSTSEFGYILRIKNSESNTIYNLFYDGQGDNLKFKFNEEGNDHLIAVELERSELPSTQWFMMKISFDLKKNTITLSINDKDYTASDLDLPDTYHPIILFGKSDYIIDVPSFAMKNLSVSNADEVYQFPLKENEGSDVHDIDGDVVGYVSNPEWLMNDAYHWRNKTSFRSQSVAGANYNSRTQEVYYFNKDSLHVYNVWTGISRTEVFKNSCPINLLLGTNFIDPDANKLYAYEVYYENQDSLPTMASLDLSTYEWSEGIHQQLPTQLHHHGQFFDTKKDEFTIFGGFGNMHYSKDFFTYQLNDSIWRKAESFSGDRISPRYFSSVGYLKSNNSLYVFGGMGNESGEQTVGRKYYYDLHKVDLDKKQVTKLWEIPWTEDNVIPVRGMVIPNDSSFYTLCYPEHFTESFLKLYKFSLKDGSYEILGDSIPIYSDKITTNANLYYDNNLKNFYALVQEFDNNDISSELEVYSLASPPITMEQLKNYSKQPKSYASWLIFISFVLMIAIAYLIIRWLASNSSKNEAAQAALTNQPEIPLQPNSIYLFGGFTARNKNNKDITYLFSAQLKQIFCLILQYSTTENGITSQRLSNILWPDKPADKVKNSRGVTIKNLRKTLTELNGIELIYDKGYFKIVYTDEFYCDYTRCLQLIADGEVETNREEFIGIVTRGKFLQLSNDPIFDSLKHKTEKKLEPVLLLEIEKAFETEDYLHTIALTNALFHIDPLNEDALNYHVKALQRLKMNDEAKIRYQAFVIEYKKIMGTDYPHPYKV